MGNVHLRHSCCICCGQDFAVCLGLLGPVLNSLHVEFFEGNAFSSEDLLKPSHPHA